MATRHIASSKSHLRKEFGYRACSSRRRKTAKNARFVSESSRTQGSHHALIRTAFHGRPSCGTLPFPQLTLHSISEAISRDPRCPMVRRDYGLQGIFLTPVAGPSNYRAGGLNRTSTHHRLHSGAHSNRRRRDWRRSTHWIVC